MEEESIHVLATAIRNELIALVITVLEGQFVTNSDSHEIYRQLRQGGVNCEINLRNLFCFTSILFWSWE